MIVNHQTEKEEKEQKKSQKSSEEKKVSFARRGINIFRQQLLQQANKGQLSDKGSKTQEQRATTTNKRKGENKIRQQRYRRRSTHAGRDVQKTKYSRETAHIHKSPGSPRAS